MALKKFQKQTGVAYNDIEKIINDLELLEKMFWFSLESGSAIDGIAVPLKREEAELVLNQSLGDFMKIYMTDVVKIFTPVMEEPQAEAQEVKKN